MMIIIINTKKRALIKYMYCIDVSSFHISFSCKNDDDIVRGRGRGSKSYDRNYYK